MWRYLAAYDDEAQVKTLHPEASYTAALREVFGDAMGSRGELYPPNFGGVSNIKEHCLSPQGERAFQRLCLVLQQLNALVYCPIVLDLIPICLIYMTEAEVYSMITRILKLQRSRNIDQEHQLMRKIQTNYAADIGLVRTFKSVLEKRYPKIAKSMQANFAYDDRYFLLLFSKIFFGFLPLPVVLRILDAYFLEGPKFFCRMAMAMFKCCRARLRHLTATGTRWWQEFRSMLREPQSNYDELFRIACRWRYAFLFKRSRLRKVFVMIRNDLDLQEIAATFGQQHPLQIVQTLSDTTDEEPVPTSSLLIDPHRDFFFRSWIPMTIQTHKLRLLYRAETHGRSLDMLYYQCRIAKSDAKMLLLCEVLKGESGDNDDNDDDEEERNIIGAFCSHPLIRRKHFFGDSRTFVFQLQPHARQYRSLYSSAYDEMEVITPGGDNPSTYPSANGTPRSSFFTPVPSPRLPRNSRVSRCESRTSNLTDADQQAFSTNYLLCRDEFISIGVSPASSAAALRLDADLVAGTTESTEMLQNPALTSDDRVEFQIGGVEVYDFVYE